MRPTQQLALSLYRGQLASAGERRTARHLLTRHRTVRQAGRAQRRLRRATQDALRLSARLDP